MQSADSRTTPWTFVLDEPLRILVVDDDPILREFASVYLATPFATIETAGDGAEAWNLLGQTTYDILLLDLEMPGLDGFSLLERIRSNDKLRHVPVVMLTGHDDIASIDRAYQLGAHAFATKPVNWRQLSYQIRYVVRASRSERLEPGSREPLRQSAPQPAASTQGDVCGFLQSIVHGADVLEGRLAVDARSQCSQAIAEVRACAEHALAGVSQPGRTGAYSPAASDARSVDVAVLS